MHANDRLISSLRFFGRAASAAAVILGGLSLVAEWLASGPLVPLFAIAPHVATLTAIGLICAGLSLWLLLDRSRGPGLRRIGLACAGVTFLIGLMTVGEYVLGLDLGINGPIFRYADDGSWGPGRPSPTAALNLLLIGLSLLLLYMEERLAPGLAQGLALVAALTPVTALVGSLYGASYAAGLPATLPDMGMRPRSALLFLALCVGIACARPERGVMAVITADGSTAATARRLLLAVVGIPLVVGLLALAGEQGGFYDLAFGFALFAVAIVVVLGVLVWGSARVLFRADTERRRAELSKHVLRTKLEAASEAGLAISDVLASSEGTKLPLVLRTIVRRARALAGARYAALGIGSDPEQAFDPWVFAGLSDEDVNALGRPPRPVGLLGAVVSEGRSLRIHLAPQDPRFVGLPAHHPPITSFLGVPIRYRGRATGHLYLANKLEAEAFSEADQQAVELLAAFAGAALEHAGIYDQLAAEVAERKRAEEALRESEQRYRTLVEMAPDVIYSLATDRTITALSPSFETVTGWVRKDWFGKPYTALVHPDDLPLAHATFEQALRGETPPPYELRVRTRSGRYLVAEFRSCPRLENGQVVGEFGIARDVTERKRAEEAHRFLAEASKVLASSLDYRTTLASVARLAVPTLADACVVGVEEDHVLHEAATAHVDPTREAVMRELWRRIPPDPDSPHPLIRPVRTGRPELLPEVADSLWETYARDPQELALLREVGITSAMVVPLAAWGRKLGLLWLGAAGSGRRYDSQDLAVAEELARRCAVAIDKAQLYGQAVQARAEAEAQRAQLQAILLSVAQGIVFVDTATGAYMANPEAVRILGRPVVPEAGVAQLVGQVCRPDGQPLAIEELAISRALRGQTIHDEELLIRRPDGGQVPVLISSAPVRDAQGQVTGAVAAFQDITALKELQRLREEWTSLIAHDLRQPVTVITGYSSLLARLAEQHPAPPQEKEGTEHIRVSAQRLDRMIADLLDFSRLEAGGLKLERQTVDLPALARQVVERTIEVTRGHSVRVEISGPIPPLQADPARVEQVLGNLLSNAAKYSYPNTEVLVEVVGRDGEVEVAVTNRGGGIPPEELPRLFTRFHRTRQALARRVGGLGLGLYISKGLVDAHGGRMWAESTPGQTTTFRFTLPIAAQRRQGEKQAA